MVRVCIVLALLVALAGATGAQNPPSPPAGQGRGGQSQATRPQGPPGSQRREWWQHDEIKAEIGLRKDQAAKIDEIYQASLPRVRSSMEDRMRAEKQLETLFSSNTATEDDVVRQLNYVQAARNEGERQRYLMLFRINRVLAPDQRTKLRAIYERMNRERREGGARGEPPKPPPVKKW